MSDLDRFVEVQISQQTAQVQIASFDIPMIVVTAADDDAVTERVLTFSTASAVGEEFGTTSDAYIMASKIFGQDLKPAQLKVGIRLSTETWVQALTNLRAIDDTWYILMTETHTAADQLAIAGYVETLRKMFFTSSDDNTVPTSGTTDIVSQLEALNYNRTVVVYSATADTEFPECAWVGSQIVEIPGSNTWAFKQVTGVTASTLSETQITFLENKNANYYKEYAGVGVFLNGVAVSGRWVDQQIFVDWIYARLQEAIFFKLVNTRKLPYTRRGAAIIESAIRSVLTQGVINGGIADDTPFTVVSPDPLAIDENVRNTRKLGDFTFTARLAGAIHAVRIVGTVSA